MEFDKPDAWTDEQRERFGLVLSMIEYLKFSKPDLFSAYISAEKNSVQIPMSIGQEIINVLSDNFRLYDIDLHVHIQTLRRYVRFMNKITDL